MNIYIEFLPHTHPQYVLLDQYISSRLLKCYPTLQSAFLPSCAQRCYIKMRANNVKLIKIMYK